MNYRVLSYYCYTPIEDPDGEVKKHHAFLHNLDVRARVYIAPSGINAQMSFAANDLPLYINWLMGDLRFRKIPFRVDPHWEHVFPRVTVKKRRQLVAFDATPDLQHAGSHLSPHQWKAMLEENDRHTLLIDVRNHYESAVGHFVGAERPNLSTFRQFPRYAEALKSRIDPKTARVMMYCTGGIRCEMFSALLKEKGFTDVYQLQGGVINYGHEVGNAHWRGKLFVFDDRLCVPISQEEHTLISTCQFCKTETDTYYNCANMDCNALFLACLECAAQLQGCCCDTCVDDPRRRLFVKQSRPKPFRKWRCGLKTRPSSGGKATCSSSS